MGRDEIARVHDAVTHRDARVIGEGNAVVGAIGAGESGSYFAAGLDWLRGAGFSVGLGVGLAAFRAAARDCKVAIAPASIDFSP
jgi:hypothetical protein